MNLPENSSLHALLGILKERNPDLLAMFRARTEDEFLEAAERAVELSGQTHRKRREEVRGSGRAGTLEDAR